MKSIIHILCCMFFVQISFGQNKKVMNNPSYDNRTFGMGIIIGFNTMDYRITPSTFLLFPGDKDSVLHLETKQHPGLNLGAIAELRLHENITLRCNPSLLFGQRDLHYTMRDFSATGEEPQSFLYVMKIPSIYISMPLQLKFRTTRLNNYRPYVITGASAKYDVETKRVSRENSGYAIRQNPVDFFYEVGFGIDWYLEYFKLGTEFKFEFGITDILRRDPTEFVDVIEKLQSQLFVISLNFE